MCEIKMEIQVSNPKIVTMLTLALEPHGLQLGYQYLNTVAEASKMFMYDTRAKAALVARATMGTPRLSVLAIMEGAACWSARPYRVLDAMYRSEFAAEMINIKMHPFRNPGRTACQHYFLRRRMLQEIPAFLMATTKGDAAAPVSTGCQSGIVSDHRTSFGGEDKVSGIVRQYHPQEEDAENFGQTACHGSSLL
jgi:hypothetical protein